MTDKDSEISDVVVRERSRLGNFIRKRVGDAAEAEDILQDVFYEFVEEYRLPESIEQASAWLFKVARNRIIDRFRKKKEVSLSEAGTDEEYWPARRTIEMFAEWFEVELHSMVIDITAEPFEGEEM